jgi:hypothetical protein
MPVRIGKGPSGEPEFRFHLMDGTKQERIYRLKQTLVRRVREGEDAAKKSNRLPVAIKPPK